ncbi:MAG: YnbE family lipoprotein [Erythrobacter sp.]
MKPVKLTSLSVTAKSEPNKGEAVLDRIAKAVLKAAGGIGAAMMLTGCVNVEAPTEPIVIELNITIQQEILVALAEDADNTIEENDDLFDF